jgi:GT2 family glycosyltransferase
VEKALEGTDYISIKLAKNEGFVGAVNRGIVASTSPFVCLLNNDTVVSSKWLTKLITTLSADDKLGIVGPVTQPLPFDPQLERYDSQHSLALHSSLLPKIYANLTLSQINEHLEKNYKGQTITISFVAFLCAVIKREVIDKVGLLDTHYDMGMYDDNDYNLAARKLGYRTELAIDTCIYHHGRTTFRLIQEKENFNVQQLLRKNLLYLNQKWGLTRGRIFLGGSNADPGLNWKPNSWRARIAEGQKKLAQKSNG